MRPAVVICPSRATIVSTGLFPRCQRHQDHDGLHYWSQTLPGRVQIEVRWHDSRDPDPPRVGQEKGDQEVPRGPSRVVGTHPTGSGS